MTCQKHRHQVSRAVAQRLGNMIMYVMIRNYFWDLLALSCRSWSIAQLFRAQLLIYTLNYWTELPGMQLLFSWLCFRVQPCPSTICCNIVHVHFRYRVTQQCILWASHCLCLVCRRVFFVVLWLLIFACSRLRAVELLRTAKPLCSSQCLFETIIVCLMLWDWRLLRAEPLLSFWPNLLFLFVSNYFLIFFLSWVGCVGLGLLIDRVFSLSLSLALTTNF